MRPVGRRGADGAFRAAALTMTEDAPKAEKPKPVILAVTGEVTDEAGFKTYVEQVVASGLFARFGATVLASGPVFEPLEGEFSPADRTTLIEFPSIEAARSFWHSPEYRELAKLRVASGTFRAGFWRKIVPRSAA